MDSILNSTKKILGLELEYNAFDLDVQTHINAAFSTLMQMGIPENGFFVTNSDDAWSDLGLPPDQLHMVKSYVFLKTKSLFDPPQTSYLINAMEKQLGEFEWRLHMMREVALPPPPVPEEVV